MRKFPHFNKSNDDICPICKKNDDKETTLVALDGTADDGIEQAIQIHTSCIYNLDFRVSAKDGQMIMYNMLLG